MKEPEKEEVYLSDLLAEVCFPYGIIKRVRRDE